MAMVKKQSSFGDYFDAQYDRLRKMLDNKNAQQQTEWQEMKNKVEELNNVRIEMLEIKSLLQELLNKKEL